MLVEDHQGLNRNREKKHLPINKQVQVNKVNMQNFRLRLQKTQCNTRNASGLLGIELICGNHTDNKFKYFEYKIKTIQVQRGKNRHILDFKYNFKYENQFQVYSSISSISSIEWPPCHCIF